MGRGVRLSEARGRMGYAHVLKPLIHKFKSSELSFHAVRNRALSLFAYHLSLDRAS